MNLKNTELPITTKLEAVHNVLRENIVNGNLKPGTPLIIRKIASELGVSVIPVREAIRSLEAQGLVTMTPHASAQVSMLNESDITEITEVRSILEGYAARAAIPLSDEAISELKLCILKMKRCVEEADFAQFGILNRKFHNVIYCNTPNTRLRKMINELLGESERTRSVFGLSATRSAEALREHEEILETIIAGKAEEVEILIRQHRQRVGKILANLLLHEKKI